MHHEYLHLGLDPASLDPLATGQNFNHSRITIMQYVTKITTKKIGIQPKGKDKPELGKVVMLATLIGIARDYKIGTSEYGEFAKFSGDFEATRASDGEVFRSARLILPAIFADSLRERLDADNGDGGARAGVQFAVEIGVVGSEVAIGYEWTLAPIGKVSGNADPLAALREEAQKALPAPKDAAKGKTKGK